MPSKFRLEGNKPNSTRTTTGQISCSAGESVLIAARKVLRQRYGPHLSEGSRCLGEKTARQLC